MKILYFFLLTFLSCSYAGADSTESLGINHFLNTDAGVPSYHLYQHHAGCMYVAHGGTDSNDCQWRVMPKALEDDMSDEADNLLGRKLDDSVDDESVEEEEKRQPTSVTDLLDKKKASGNIAQ